MTLWLHNEGCINRGVWWIRKHSEYSILHPWIIFIFVCTNKHQILILLCIPTVCRFREVALCRALGFCVALQVWALLHACQQSLSPQASLPRPSPSTHLFCCLSRETHVTCMALKSYLFFSDEICIPKILLQIIVTHRSISLVRLSDIYYEIHTLHRISAHLSLQPGNPQPDSADQQNAEWTS